MKVTGFFFDLILPYTFEGNDYYGYKFYYVINNTVTYLVFHVVGRSRENCRTLFKKPVKNNLIHFFSSCGNALHKYDEAMLFIKSKNCDAVSHCVAHILDS